MGTHAKRLAKARKKRHQIAAHLRALKTGALSLESVLEHPPPALARVAVYQVIIHSQHMGPAGAKKCLTTAKVWPETPLGSLKREELDRVRECLPPRARYRRVA